MSTAWLAGWMALSLGAQLITGDHFLTGSQIVAAGAALAAWHFAPRAARAKWCAILLAAAILLRQLQPFYLVTVPNHFSWIPFAATLNSVHSNALIIIGRKAFDYGALVYALRSLGWRYTRAGLAVAGVLACTEGVQVYLPGRTPEVADPLVALLMSGAFRALGE
jgi:hypothetical protein